VIRAAIESGLQLQLDYLNQLGERSSRTVDPLRIDFVGSRYYLRGYCYKNQNIRSFRVDRIAGLEQLETQISQESLGIEIPEDVFGGGEDQHIVTISCSKWASEIFWNFPLVGEPKVAGELLEGQIRVGNLRALGRHIARYGGQVKVLEPASAVLAVREYALEVLKFQEGE
jgi:proteasome accessory factor C